MKIAFEVTNSSVSTVKLSWASNRYTLSPGEIYEIPAEATNLFDQSSKGKSAQSALQDQLNKGLIEITLVTDIGSVKTVQTPSTPVNRPPRRSESNLPEADPGLEETVRSAAEEAQKRSNLPRSDLIKVIKADDLVGTDKLDPAEGTSREEQGERLLDMTQGREAVNRKLRQTDQIRAMQMSAEERAATDTVGLDAEGPNKTESESTDTDSTDTTESAKKPSTKKRSSSSTRKVSSGKSTTKSGPRSPRKRTATKSTSSRSTSKKTSV